MTLPNINSHPYNLATPTEAEMLAAFVEYCAADIDTPPAPRWFKDHMDEVIESQLAIRPLAEVAFIYGVLAERNGWILQ